VREEEVLAAARTEVYVLDPLHAGGAQAVIRDRAQVEHPPIGEARVELVAHLVTDFVTARADARANGSRRRLGE
jgi:hypothetical protein